MCGIIIIEGGINYGNDRKNKKKFRGDCMGETY